ncbi:MAG: response regulator [Candidatus Zixiibacteriota bacterium]|nr:MAG: response regulator [candidate division Zixibacteria bacterium]
MMRILLIEDDRDQAFLAQAALEEGLGEIDFTLAETGGEALNLDLAVFDAIILDFNLPDMTGLEILRRISQRPHGPVIMVTGEEVIEIAVDALKEGAEDFVIKSYELQQLLPRIVERTIASFQQRRMVEDMAIREREKKVQIETLKRVMMTLAHHLNNAIMPVTFSAELCERSNYAPDTTRRLVDTCIKETHRISAILERFEEYVESEEFKYTDYLDLKNAMFDVEHDHAES